MRAPFFFQATPLRSNPESQRRHLAPLTFWNSNGNRANRVVASPVNAINRDRVNATASFSGTFRS
jgi:hypothetical protein